MIVTEAVLLRTPRYGAPPGERLAYVVARGDRPHAAVLSPGPSRCSVCGRSSLYLAHDADLRSDNGV
jgi:hypothetical protein